MTERHDYYVHVRQADYPYKIYEQHALLTSDEADRCRCGFDIDGFDDYIIHLKEVLRRHTNGSP